MSAGSPAPVGAGPPATPRPAGVVDLGRYRGRTVAAPAVVPPPRPDDAGEARSRLAEGVSVPVLVPDGNALEPAAAPRPPAAASVLHERVVHRFRLRSVLKMAFGFSLCVFLVVIGAGVLIWLTIATLGVVQNVESLAEDLGWVDVRFDGPAMLRAATIGGGIAVVAATLLSVVFAEVFNLLSAITGGLRAEVGPPAPSRRERRVARRSEG